MHCVSVKNLSVKFGGLVALDDVTFNLEKGEILSIIGPNGAGKTTLFNAITGFLKPSKGKIIFNGENITGMKTHQISKLGIIRTFQLNTLFMNHTVIENILIALYSREKNSLMKYFFDSKYKNLIKNNEKKEALNILEKFSLKKEANQLASTLPHGLQKRLNIAVAMTVKPKVLLLDEPATGLNQVEQKYLIKKIIELNNKGVTPIIVEHDMKLVMKISKRIIVLNFGELIANGTPEEIKTNPSVIKAYLGESNGYS